MTVDEIVRYSLDMEVPPDGDADEYAKLLMMGLFHSMIYAIEHCPTKDFLQFDELSLELERDKWDSYLVMRLRKSQRLGI